MITIATHNGGFHADDVFAVAAFQLLLGLDNISVIRTRDEAVIASADYVVDVGGVYDHKQKRYDHHQNGAPMRENGIPYAGFGFMWRHYGAKISCSDEVAAAVDEKLCWPIDLIDNAIPVWERGQYDIAPFSWDGVLQTWRAEESRGEDMDEQFLEAADLARAYLKRKIQREQVKLEQKQKAQALYESSQEHAILVSDMYIPRSEFIDKEDVNTVVFPRAGDMGAGWVAVAVQVSKDSFQTRVQFPEAWAGLRDQELAHVSDIEDAVFCHKDRYMFIAQTRESAIAAAKLAK